MNKIREFLKASKKSKLVIVCLIIVIGVIIKLTLFSKGPLQEGTPFTVEEYEEILDKKNLTENGIPRDIEDFFMKGEEVEKALKSVKNIKSRRQIVNATLLLEKNIQIKIENYSNPEVMDKLGKESGEIIYCSVNFLPSQRKAVRDLQSNFKKRNRQRYSAILNADRYYGFKIMKTIRPSESECIKILNRGLNQNL